METRRDYERGRHVHDIMRQLCWSTQPDLPGGEINTASRWQTGRLALFMAGLFQGQVQCATRAGKVFGGVLGDFAELESVAITVFIPDDCCKFNGTAAKGRRELQLNELPFLELQNGIET